MKEEDADRREWSVWPLERGWAKKGVCEEGFLCSWRGYQGQQAQGFDLQGRSIPIMEVNSSDSSMNVFIKTIQLHPFASTLGFPGNIRSRLWLLQKTFLHM